ncbi:hypothetical protein MUK42_20541 [Musa troglodytarum]|uniref:Uncharacterized protein n=1 Tax=Musa troglodytarum TaxID=320322 RepID=A0A9E7FY95_9LILI|nr:hypothetical protein MUK42_20541 [Musa troglodytarum]
MGSYGGGKREDSRFAWNVFDSVKAFPPPTPEALMDDIDAAISALEYARSTAALLASSSSKVEEEAAPESEIYQPPATSSEPIYDKRIADEAYKAACAALAAGKTDAAIRSLHLSSGKDHGSRQTPLPARPRLLSAAKAATTALATASYDFLCSGKQMQASIQCLRVPSRTHQGCLCRVLQLLPQYSLFFELSR